MLFFYSTLKFTMQNYREANFVNNNDVVLMLAAKYNYSVFDFQLARKEAHLKHVGKELNRESGGVFYQNPV